MKKSNSRKKDIRMMKKSIKNSSYILCISNTITYIPLFSSPNLSLQLSAQYCSGLHRELSFKYSSTADRGRRDSKKINILERLVVWLSCKCTITGLSLVLERQNVPLFSSEINSTAWEEVSNLRRKLGGKLVLSLCINNHNIKLYLKVEKEIVM